MVCSPFRTRLDLLAASIPIADRRRTPRGVMRTCRDLGEHIRHARQLYAIAANDSDRESVDQLIAEIDRRRAVLAQGTDLSAQVRAARDARRTSGRWPPLTKSG